MDAWGYEIPFDGYWTVAGQVFSYPLVTVFAPNGAAADKIAGHQYSVRAQRAACELAMDSAEAQIRLGVFGRPDLIERMRRGDEPEAVQSRPPSA